MTKDEATELVLRLLREEYPLAKTAMIELEVYRRTRSRKAVYELRDFLDHLAGMATKDEPGELITHHHEARTHLRRCIVEPMEYLAERQYLKLWMKVQYTRFMSAFPGNPTVDLTVRKKMAEAQDLIVRGRQEKTNNGAYGTFKESFGISRETHLQMSPVVRTGLVFVAWIIGVASGTCGVLKFFGYFAGSP